MSFTEGYCGIHSVPSHEDPIPMVPALNSQKSMMAPQCKFS